MTQLLDKCRRHLTKAWFELIKRQAKQTKFSHRAIKFAATIDQGHIVEEDSMAHYLRNLYHDSLKLNFRVSLDNPIYDERLEVTQDIMLELIGSYNKAKL